MSAAAARRRKQLAARSTATNGSSSKGNDQDVVSEQLRKILDTTESMSEETAYEALQLAVSAVRRSVRDGKFAQACDMAYSSSLALLGKDRVAVASQLLAVLVDVLRETHTAETEQWVQRMAELNAAQAAAMERISNSSANNAVSQIEANRLLRLQRSWLLTVVQWSSDLGNVRYGHNALQELLGAQCWKLAGVEDDEDESMELRCDAIQHMALAEKPDVILEWLKTVDGPTDETTASGHTCPPAPRDSLLTRALLLFCAVENLRDANALLRACILSEERDMAALAASYTKKDDGKAPSHVMFGCMLLRVCEKDARTGPLFQWLLRSFKRELDMLHKPQAVLSFTSKIGKLYFNIQPPPSMINMVENMMGMMGGGGGGGMNPAMMQQMLAQLQGGM